MPSSLCAPPPPPFTHRAKKLGICDQPQAKRPPSTCPLTAHFQLARSSEAGASPPWTAASPRVPCPLPAPGPPQTGALLTRGATPSFPHTKIIKKNLPALCTASSNFRNCSQLTGTQETGRLLGDRARLSAAGGPALRGRLLCTSRLGAAVPGVGHWPGSNAPRQRPRLHGAAPTERCAAAHPGGRVGAPGACLPFRGDRASTGSAAGEKPSAAARRAASPLPGSITSRAPGPAGGRGARGHRSPHWPRRGGE